MDFSIKADSITSLLDSWIEAERNGVKFPVPFDMAYPMAGYSRKDNAKRVLSYLVEGVDYSIISQQNTGGRPSQLVMINVKAFKFFCDRARYIRKTIQHPKAVYIMQCIETKVIKIGVSNCPTARLATIQTSYPFPLNIVRIIQSRRLSGVRLERELHKALDDFRLNGEWFDGLALQMIGEV